MVRGSKQRLPELSTKGTCWQGQDHLAQSQAGEHSGCLGETRQRLCRLWYLEQKYAEQQITAFRCHRRHLTRHFSGSRLHYQAGASRSGCSCVGDRFMLRGLLYTGATVLARVVRLMANPLWWRSLSLRVALWVGAYVGPGPMCTQPAPSIIL